jgi:hypothetical protein
MVVIEPDDADEGVCIDGYPEHDERVLYEDDSVCQWECIRCGAEVFEKKQ